MRRSFLDLSGRMRPDRSKRHRPPPRSRTQPKPAGSVGPIYCAAFSCTRSTTPRTGDATGPIRITHPFHPLFGQEIDFVFHRHNWGVDRVFFRDRHGHLASLPARWTSVVPEDAFVTVAAGRSRFRVEDLIALVALVRRLRS